MSMRRITVISNHSTQIKYKVTGYNGLGKVSKLATTKKDAQKKFNEYKNSGNFAGVVLYNVADGTIVSKWEESINLSNR